MTDSKPAPLVLYLDWNVFNQLEHLATLDPEERQIYEALHALVYSEQFIVPYSNAHIRDLARGFLKNDQFAAGHLQNITSITNNFCITQYWGEDQVRWHYRDPAVFLLEAVEELRKAPTSISNLFDIEGLPEAKAIWEIQRTALEKVPLHEGFRKMMDADPVFDLMFPTAKEKNNLLGFMDDMLTLSSVLGTDYTLYKRFRKFLSNAQQQMPALMETAKALMPEQQMPQQLNWDNICDQVAQKGSRTANQGYDKIIDAFTLTDLKGYRADERFANLIDDALHCFYAAHGAYFISLDKRCRDKAEKVYEQLGIATKVTTPAEFVQGLAK